jgi:hypothetical protein
MAILFYLVNCTMGTLGSYFVFKKFRHMGLLAAGIALVTASILAMPDERWWPMGLGAIAAVALHRLIGDPLEA